MQVINSKTYLKLLVKRYCFRKVTLSAGPILSIYLTIKVGLRIVAITRWAKFINFIKMFNKIWLVYQVNKSFNDVITILTLVLEIKILLLVII